MARTRSSRIEEVKSRLKTRLLQGVHRPGDRFPSARDIAARFEISYQTAHRLLAELHEEGLLERRAASGSYIPGGVTLYDGVHLLFSPRARRSDSFGGRLLDKLQRRLKRDGIKFRLDFCEGETVRPKRDYFPVLWEVPLLCDACLKANRPAMLLNNRPRPGLYATLLDSVSIDDFSGGAGAAQLLLRSNGENKKDIAVVAGPQDDARSQMRVAGFISVLQSASVVSAGSWFFEDGYATAPTALKTGKNGIFCANDRLSHALSTFARDNALTLPALVGFDDAPIAETIGLTTMAIPWDELIFEVAQIIKKRLSGDVGVARQIILTPRPIVRSAVSSDGIKSSEPIPRKPS